jgi:hypothetical protein
MDTDVNPNQPSSTETPSPLTLPNTANSIPGLIYMGFTPKTALQIFTTYTKHAEPFSSPCASNYDFFSFIHGHILHINSPTFKTLSNRESMDKIGICQTVQDGILDPVFVGVYKKKSLGFWIEDTVRLRYRRLLRLTDGGYEEEDDEFWKTGYRPRTE